MATNYHRFNNDEPTEFEALIAAYNNACERQDDYVTELAERELLDYGAWVDAANCWRDKDDHDPRTLPEILGE